MIRPLDVFNRQHLELTLQIARREVSARYRGSWVGMAWVVINPILSLAIYTFVFAVVFRARWPTISDNESTAAEFAVIVLAGLVLHGFFAECLTKAPTQIIGNPNYVKKAVFPLEVLAGAQLIAALVHLLPALLVLLLFQWWVFGPPPPTLVLVPLILLPLSLLALGMMWILSALTVYFRDVAQIVGLLVTAMLFLAPVLYPVEFVPEPMQAFMYLNPLTFGIEAMRDLALWGQLPSLKAYGLYLICALVLGAGGFLFFQWLRDGFVDVI